MFAPFKAFKKPVILEEELHRDLKIFKPYDYSFMKDVETVPLGFSELLPASMYYPVMFGIFEGEIFPFAVLGVNRKNVYLNDDGFFKVDVIPKAVQVYPFGVIRQKNEDRIDWVVIVDEALKGDEGEKLFEENGEDTAYLKSVKTELSELALDFQKAYEFCKEIYSLKCLKPIDFEVSTKWGKARFKNILIGNIDTLSKIQPEKLYFLNTAGYLPIIYSVYLSVRNFRLFDLIS